MSVSSYIDSKTGEQLFKIRARRSSSVQVGLEIDKRQKGFKTLAAAEKAERKLLLEAERELLEAEQKGLLWSTLVDEWEKVASGDNAAESIFQKQLNPNTIADYTICIRTHCKEWEKLHAKEIDRALAWLAPDRGMRGQAVLAGILLRQRQGDALAGLRVERTGVGDAVQAEESLERVRRIGEDFEEVGNHAELRLDGVERPSVRHWRIRW